MARALIYLLLVAGSQARGTGIVEGEEAPVAKDVEKAADGVSVNDRKGKCKPPLFLITVPRLLDICINL